MRFYRAACASLMLWSCADDSSSGPGGSGPTGGSPAGGGGVDGVGGDSTSNGGGGADAGGSPTVGGAGAGGSPTGGGGSPACGDGDCDAGEDCTSCVGDCGACPICGDGAVTGSEACDPNSASSPCCADDCSGAAPMDTACGADPDGPDGCAAPPQCDGSSASAAACVAQSEADGALCDDGLFCNGSDSCTGGSCVVHAGDPCGGSPVDDNCAESCDELAEDCFADDPDGAPCDDGQLCNGADTCLAGACATHGGSSCPISRCIDNGVERDAVAPQPGDLVISELMPSPNLADADGEWFEVTVLADIDLHGLELGADASNVITLSDNDCRTRTPGARLVFVRSPDTVANGGISTFEATFDHFGLPSGATTAGTIYLGHLGSPLDDVAWTQSATGASRSLDPDAVDVVANDDESNWCDGTAVYGAGRSGTPGNANPNCPIIVPSGMCLEGQTLRSIVSPVVGDLVITEFMANPGDSTASGDAGKEWFEVLVVNACDLNGLTLRRTTLTETLPVGPDCLPAAPATRLVFSNGTPATAGIPSVDYSFGFTLNQTGSCAVNVPLALEIGATELDHICYGTAPTAASRTLMTSATNTTSNDSPLSYCTSTSVYATLNGVDHSGTPGAEDPSCP